MLASCQELRAIYNFLAPPHSGRRVAQGSIDSASQSFTDEFIDMDATDHRSRALRQIYQTTVTWVTGRRRPMRHHFRITMRRAR
jgi:hypothetical protein